MRRTTLGMLGAAAALSVSTCGAPDAHAARVVTDGATLVLRADPGEANRLLVVNEDGELRLTDDDANAIAIDAPGCVREDWQGPGAVTCAVADLRVELGDGADVFDTGTQWGATALAVDGGPGDDDVDGGEGDDVLTGGAGNDVVRGLRGNDRVLGGDGTDTLKGGNGRDEVRGEAGDDVVGDEGYEAEPDVIDGGPGRDTLSPIEWSDAGSGRTQQPATLTLDGVADDGRPGEGDNATSMEVAKLTVPMTMRAAGEAVEFSVFNTVTGSTTLVGSPAADVLTGFDHADRIDGGAGDDTIQGGYGDDAITGGPGRDTINADVSASWCGIFQCRAPHGNDTVDARDGEADSIDCGVGTDVARVDAVDVVAGCETVERAGGPGGEVGPGGGTPGQQPPAKLRLAGGTPKRVARTGLRVRLTGFRAGKVTVRVRLGKRTLARRKATVGASGELRLRVRFDRAAKRALARRRTAKLVVTAGGVRRTVTLKR